MNWNGMVIGKEWNDLEWNGMKGKAEQPFFRVANGGMGERVVQPFFRVEPSNPSAGLRMLTIHVKDARTGKSISIGGQKLNK